MSSKDIDLETGERTPLIKPVKAAGSASPSRSAPTTLGALLGDEEQDLEDVKEWTKREKAVAGVSAISFTTSAAAMIFYPQPIVYVSGLIGCGVAPYVAFQQQKITEVRALQETNLRFQEEIDELEGETTKIQVQVQDLQSTVSG